MAGKMFRLFVASVFMLLLVSGATTVETQSELERQKELEIIREQEAQKRLETQKELEKQRRRWENEDQARSEMLKRQQRALEKFELTQAERKAKNVQKKMEQELLYSPAMRTTVLEQKVEHLEQKVAQLHTIIAKLENRLVLLEAPAKEKLNSLKPASKE